MNEHPLQAFIDLVAFDRELVALESAIAKQEQEVGDLHNQLLQITQTIEQAERRAYDARKDVDSKELEMKELDERHAKEKERLDTVSNNKQYKAIKAEIENLKRQQSDLDEVLLEVWNKLEAVQKESSALKEESEASYKEKEAEIVQKNASIAELKQKHSALMEQRVSQEKPVPEEWLERYRAMRARVSDPVVPVVHGSCSACFWAVPNQDMLTLKRKALLQCKGCYRFLYVPDEAMQQEKVDKEQSS